jgi:hypothetical protein
MLPWLEVGSLGADVVIVLLFLRYLTRRDSAITGIAERCHKTQEAGHEAIRQLTAAVMKCNGLGRSR